jgi:hypothetical protein
VKVTSGLRSRGVASWQNWRGIKENWLQRGVEGNLKSPALFSKAKILSSFIRGRLFLYEVAGTGDIVGRLRNRTSRLMF